jgi:hypothetical protein
MHIKGSNYYLGIYFETLWNTPLQVERASVGVYDKEAGFFEKLSTICQTKRRRNAEDWNQNVYRRENHTLSKQLSLKRSENLCCYRVINKLEFN